MQLARSSEQTTQEVLLIDLRKNVNIQGGRSQAKSYFSITGYILYF